LAIFKSLSKRKKEMTSKETPLDDLIDENEDFSFSQVILDVDSPCYKSGGSVQDAIASDIAKAFQIDVTDECETKGCLTVEIGSVEGHLNTYLNIKVNVAKLPGTQLSVPCVEISNGVIGQTTTVYQAGNDLTILSKSI
jgi:uncharacterized protein YydD (DUF2326 family)